MAKVLSVVTVSCAECRFFASWPSGGWSGECRRRAPTVVMRQHGAGFNHEEGVWPPVAPTSWCGEFEPRSRGRSKAAK